MQLIQIHLLQQVTMPKLSVFPIVSMQNECFFLKSNMQIIQIHLLPKVTMPKLSVSPLYQYNSVQITQIWGYWRCEQGILRCRSTPHEYAENMWHHSGLSAWFFMHFILQTLANCVAFKWYGMCFIFYNDSNDHKVLIH